MWNARSSASCPAASFIAVGYTGSRSPSKSGRRRQLGERPESAGRQGALRRNVKMSVTNGSRSTTPGAASGLGNRASRAGRRRSGRRRGRRRRARPRGPWPRRPRGSSSRRCASARIVSADVPTSFTTPSATASGRSVSSRRTSTGLPSAGASSCTPPESVTIRNDALHRGHERRVLQRLAEHDARVAAEDLARGPRHVRVQVDGVEHLHVVVARRRGSAGPRTPRAAAGRSSRAGAR